MKFNGLVVLSVALALPAVFVPHGPATASDTVAFTAAQAAAGSKTYAQSCASCHGATLKGITAPALVGKTSAIAQQTVVECYEYASQQMPMTAPGTLSKTQYLDIVAFLLQKNGHVAGLRPLTEAVAITGTATIVAKP